MSWQVGLEQALSSDRLGRYLEWAGGDRDAAFALYALNTRLSESLYTPLQMLEVTLRNRIHAVMTEARHEAWFLDEGVLLADWQPEQLAKAMENIAADGKSPSPSRIVAGLTFSFWTAMFGRKYETLWQTTLNRTARRPSGKGLRRKDLTQILTPTRLLRNRIAHHEPIIAWDLPKHYRNIVALTSWLAPEAAAWTSAHSRFPETYPATGIYFPLSPAD